MLYLQMASQDLRVKSALEANNIVRPHRAADRDRGRQWCRGRGRPVLPKAAQRALHRRNQISELVDLGSRSLGTHIGKPLKNIRYLSRDGAIWACANLRD